MRALFWLITLSGLAIGVALLGQLSEGYVLWVVPPWRVEISLNLFVVAELLLLILAYLLVRAVIETLRLPARVGEYRAQRAKERDARAAAEVLRLWWEGRYSQSLKEAEKVGADSTASAARGIAALVGLRCAHALRDEARIAVWQKRAAALDAEGWRTARLMGDIRDALDARDYASAAAALDALAPQERRRIAAQRLALRLAQGQGDWAGLLRLVRQLEKHKALTPLQAQPLRLHAYHGLLDAIQDDPAQLERLWRSLPEADRLDLRLAQRTAAALAQAGACAESARLIEDYLDERWESELLEIYADCPAGDVLSRIAHCEKWLGEHPHDAALLFALGRLCLQRQLWGKAQSYLEASLAVKESASAHLTLARLFDQLDKPEQANRHYRMAAQLSSTAPQIHSRGGRKSV